MFNEVDVRRESNPAITLGTADIRSYSQKHMCLGPSRVLAQGHEQTSI